MKPLAGKIALVTGGTRGIGAASARHLAAAGADIAMTYSHSAAEASQMISDLEKLGVRARAYQADAAAPDKLPQVVERILADLGGIDILVNNAGTFAGGMIGEVDAADYRRVMTVNVDAVFSLTQATLEVMPDGGRIINIGSVLGERAASPGLSPYNASKFASPGSAAAGPRISGRATSWSTMFSPDQSTRS